MIHDEPDRKRTTNAQRRRRLRRTQEHGDTRRPRRHLRRRKPNQSGLCPSGRRKLPQPRRRRTGIPERVGKGRKSQSAHNPEPRGDGFGELAATRNQRGIRAKTEPRHRRVQENGHTHLLHLHALPDRQPAPIRGTRRLVRIIRRNLRQLGHRSKNQQGRRTIRVGSGVRRQNPLLRASSGREQSARHSRASKREIGKAYPIGVRWVTASAKRRKTRYHT